VVQGVRVVKEARTAIFDWIDRQNKTLRHSGIEYLSPIGVRTRGYDSSRIAKQSDVSHLVSKSNAKILSYLPHRQVSTLDESDRVFFEFVVKSFDEYSLS